VTIVEVGLEICLLLAAPLLSARINSLFPEITEVAAVVFSYIELFAVSE